MPPLQPMGLVQGLEAAAMLGPAAAVLGEQGAFPTCKPQREQSSTYLIEAQHIALYLLLLQPLRRYHGPE